MTERKTGTGPVREAIEAAAPPEDIPVIPLGLVVNRVGGAFHFFLTRGGRIYAMRHRDLSRAGIGELFGGVTDWLEENHPDVDKSGKSKGGWLVDAAREDLIRRSEAAGDFDPDHMVRGAGAWRGPEGGLIVHAGDRVFIEGNWIDAGKRIGNFVYPKSRAFSRPAPTPASSEEVASLHDFLETWSWRRPVEAPRILLGWLGCAMICGALYWRPHLWVTGGKGAGKSTLENLVFSVLGDGLYRASDPTAAGIRQGLGGGARAVAVDEIEFEPGSKRAETIVELARIASTDSQAAIVRGTVDGNALSYFIRSTFYFSSIVHAPMRPQDRSRVTVLECQWRSKKGPPRRCKKGPLGGCGLVPVVHGRAPRATRRALNRLTRRRAREGPVGPRGQAWAGWSVQLAVGV